MRTRREAERPLLTLADDDYPHLPVDAGSEPDDEEIEDR